MNKPSFACILSIAFVGMLSMSEPLVAGDPMRPPIDVQPLEKQKEKKKTVKPEFVLTHIVYSGERTIAYINGEPYRTGQKINGATIAGITKESVVLNRNGRKIFLRLSSLSE